MNIKIYQPDFSTTAEFSKLLQKKYGKSNNFDYFLDDFNKAFNFCLHNENINFYPIAGLKEKGLVAHIALIIDKRLPKGEAFFGFLEVPNDVSIFNSIWRCLKEEAKKRGISVLKGPVNGSIWHQYRCIKKTDDSDFFKTELFCESYYYNFLASNKPSAEIPYYSGCREKYDVVLQIIGEDAYKKIETTDFSITVKNQITPQELKKIADISKTIFNKSWGYTELDETELMQLYSSEKLNAHLNTLYFLYKGKEIIGFCSTSKENEDTLILKTIGIVAPYQGLGLGNAMAYKIHLDAKKDGYKKIIYALIREGNNIKNYPQEEVKIFRRYSAFEFNI